MGTRSKRPSLLGDVPLDAARVREVESGQPTATAGTEREATLTAALQATRSQLQEALLAAERARSDLEKARRAKSDFLAIMSHELRTPLNAMIGYSDLLLAGIPEPVPAAAWKNVKRIGISARHLLELIEEILTFARLEAGEERAALELVSLDTVLQEVTALIEPLADERGLSYDCRAPGGPHFLNTDAAKLRQILVNLLDNAVKFTDRGGVSLHVSVAGGTATFRIADTGSGIEPEHAEAIFEPFWQAGSAMTRSTGGTGVGLTVSQRLTRLIGGDIEVSSEPGRGSTFTVTIPTEATGQVAAPVPGQG